MINSAFSDIDDVTATRPAPLPVFVLKPLAPLSPIGAQAAPAVASPQPPTDLDTTNDTPAKKPYTTQDITGLAHDMAMYGGTDFEKVLTAYGVTEPEYNILRTTSAAFKAADKHIKEQMAADPHLPTRRVAQGYLMHRVHSLNKMATSPLVEPAVQLKAIDMLKDIAGLDVKRKDDLTKGVAVQINFGSALGNQLAATMTLAGD